MNRVLPALMLFMTLTLAGLAVGQPPLPGPVDPIVNGQPESGWPQVGAMTLQMPGFGYMGSYCSGTLIAPQWVLTAAHCVLPGSGMPVSSKLGAFYVGANANKEATGNEPSGRILKADIFIPHPDYNATWASSDIALVHLQEPVTDLEPVPIFQGNLTKDDLGTEVLYVGFGVTDGIQQGGGGTKRSGYMPIVDLDKRTYISAFQESGVCFGDSGGPGLLQVEGKWYVLGVNSAVYAQSGDPCKGYAIQTRVDAFRDWILEHTQGDEPDCAEYHDMCHCQVGCQADGSCNNEACKTYSCAKVYECWRGCEGDSDCQVDCYLRGKPQATDLWQNISMCSYMMCQGAADKDLCLRTKCKKHLGKCIPLETGDEACRFVQECISNDPDDDEGVVDCINAGDVNAQTQWNELVACYATNGCAAFPRPSLGGICGWTNCGKELDTCLPPADCSIIGGSCPASSACALTPRGKFDCFASQGGVEGEPCDVTVKDPLPCGDGLACVDLGEGGVCGRLCGHDGHCPAGKCVSPIWPGVDIGVCYCLDLDKDGACQPQDCDDNNDSRSPLADEVCGNGVDDNCNGKIDEECAVTGEDLVTDAENGEVGTDTEEPVSGGKSAGSGGCSSNGGGSTGMSLLMSLLTILFMVRLRVQRRGAEAR